MTLMFVSRERGGGQYATWNVVMDWMALGGW